MRARHSARESLPSYCSVQDRLSLDTATKQPDWEPRQLALWLLDSLIYYRPLSLCGKLTVVRQPLAELVQAYYFLLHQHLLGISILQ